MTTLAFVMPVYRRFDLTRVCVTQLTRTCAELADRGIQATAVIIGDDENVDFAELCGFATVRQANSPLGRKWNDGIEYACTILGCEYIVPFGSDNWVDAELIANLPPAGTIRAHRLCTLIHESGERVAQLKITYEGGDGIRIIPSELLENLAYRPAIEDRQRAIDTSMRERMKRESGYRPVFDYWDRHQLQIVGFQSAEQQLNEYRGLRMMFANGEELRGEPWEHLATAYPQEAVDEVREVFERRRVLVA